MLGITIVTFFLLRLIPGDPAATLLGNHGARSRFAALRTRWGLDDPIWTQFWLFLKQLAHGDTGASLFYEMPTRTLIASRIGVTMSLVAFATLFSVLIAVPLATIAADPQGPAHGPRDPGWSRSSASACLRSGSGWS